MQIAEILSDLTSLRVCDHEAALVLVTNHKALDRPSGQNALKQSDSSLATNGRPSAKRRTSGLKDVGDDPDLQRALDLVELHYGVKERHMYGVDKGLQKARNDVALVLESMNTKRNNASTPLRR